jgi:hypothetical protein
MNLLAPNDGCPNLRRRGQLVTGANDVRAACGYPPKDPALAVRCSICRAVKDDPCINPATKKRMPAPHLARITEAETTATILPFQPRGT